MAEVAKKVEKTAGATKVVKTTEVAKSRKTAHTTKAAKATESAEAVKTSEAKHVGIYVNGNPKVALFTILLPDNTCGMFLMPSPQDIFWTGFTTYKAEGDKLYFKIQNTSTDPKAPPKKPSTAAGKEQFLEATLKPGVEYIQHSQKQDTKFIFLTDNVSFWQKLGWKKMGEVRQLEGMKDFDIAHEIKKYCLLLINKFGPVFVWS